MQRRQPTQMQADWQLCVRRIRRVLQEDKFAEKCRSAEDLCEILEDGEILGDILSELTDGYICTESTYYSVSSRYLAQKNLKFFLKNARSFFGLADDELFEPEDLLEAKQPQKVVAALNLLLKRSGRASQEEEEQEAVGDKKVKELQGVVQEICSCEEKYVQKLVSLKKIQEQLLGPLSEWQPEFVHSVFDFLNDLYCLHEQNHRHLKDMAEQGHEAFCMQLGGHFSSLQQSLKLYKQVLCSISKRQKEMEAECEKTSVLKSQVQVLAQKFGQGYSFESLYASPYKYPFDLKNMLDRLLNAVESKLPDAKESVETAQTTIKHLLDSANEHLRHQENELATKELLGSIAGLPPALNELQDTGLHVTDTVFKVRVEQREKKTKKDHDRCLCLLTKRMLIVANEAGNGEHRYSFHCRIADSMEVSVKKPRVLDVNFENEVIKLANPRGDSQKILDDWRLQLEQLRNLNFPVGWNSNGHSFELATFDEGTCCSYCGQELESFMHHGYECKSHCDHELQDRLRQQGHEFVSHCQERLHIKCLEKKQSVARRASLPPLPQQSALKFFHKNADRNRTNALLQTESVGAFLFRPRSDAPQQKVLTVKTDQSSNSHVIVIERSVGGRKEFSLDKSEMWHSSLEGLIKFYQENSLEYHFPDLRFKLKNGVPTHAGSETWRRQSNFE